MEQISVDCSLIWLWFSNVHSFVCNFQISIWCGLAYGGIKTAWIGIYSGRFCFGLKLGFPTETAVCSIVAHLYSFRSSVLFLLLQAAVRLHHKLLLMSLRFELFELQSVKLSLDYFWSERIDFLLDLFPVYSLNREIAVLGWIYP